MSAQKESEMTEMAIIDFYIKQLELGSWPSPIYNMSATREQIEQLAHFVKIGVKVRLK